MGLKAQLEMAEVRQEPPEAILSLTSLWKKVAALVQPALLSNRADSYTLVLVSGLRLGLPILMVWPWPLMPLTPSIS